MTVKPLGERVLIEVKTSEEKTSGGIVIPQAAQEKTQEGKVIAIGSSDTIKVKVGDKVIYDKYAGTQIKIGDRDHLLIKFEEILAVID
ncbi:MAG TPA: co-chaperone GroES [Spirochaetota bacterium]|nr:co-chaperone GroES [Spirochaetota bacterium]HOS32316.1 co-chaperone GroES [Spirochaetota bacterium]HOS54670.1 co-chaperone GroES [Spirochaetota bacterium]HPK60982.1 co-chaperone GroES [Spirochaetota bacterium]HQF77310.1 co-chaperone GroES [Spirochaetota bacterium]